MRRLNFGIALTLSRLAILPVAIAGVALGYLCLLLLVGRPVMPDRPVTGTLGSVLFGVLAALAAAYVVECASLLRFGPEEVGSNDN